MPTKDSQKPPHPLHWLYYSFRCRLDLFVLTGAFISYAQSAIGWTNAEKKCVRGIYDPCLVSNRNTPCLLQQNGQYLPMHIKYQGPHLCLACYFLFCLSPLRIKAPKLAIGNCEWVGNPNLGPSFVFFSKNLFSARTLSLISSLFILFSYRPFLPEISSKMAEKTAKWTSEGR